MNLAAPPAASPAPAARPNPFNATLGAWGLGLILLRGAIGLAQDAMFSRWEAAAPPSFWTTRDGWPAALMVVIGIATLVGMAASPRWKWWIGLYGPLLVALVGCGTARAGVGLLPDRVVLRSAWPWVADQAISLDALTLTERACAPVSHRSGITYRLVLRAQWRDADGRHTLNLGRGAAARPQAWLDAAATLARLVRGPSATAAYEADDDVLSGTACLARYAQTLDPARLATLRALVG